MTADSFADRLQRDARTGVCVGLTDIALVYPLAVLATRRENGLSLRNALAQGRLHSGGLTAGTLLVPYSVLVETMSQQLQAMQASSDRDGRQLQMLGAAAATSLIASIGVQPIEKKLVMDQMLESSKVDSVENSTHRGANSLTRGNPLLQPLKQILAYRREHGTRALYAGFTPLLGREFIYIAAITAVNPTVSSWAIGNGTAHDDHFALFRGGLAAFSVGCTAGVLSAPCQTLNAMMKTERYRCSSVATIVRGMFAQGWASGFHRLYFGAMTRSVRCGGAGVLYFGYRRINGSVDD